MSLAGVLGFEPGPSFKQITLQHKHDSASPAFVQTSDKLLLIDLALCAAAILHPDDETGRIPTVPPRTLVP